MEEDDTAPNEETTKQDLSMALAISTKLSLKRQREDDTQEMDAGNLMYNSGLMDLNVSGCQFTWSNHRRGDQETKEKIDRVMANCSWSGLYPNAEAVSIPPISSDHSPIIININPVGGSRRDFRFEAFWTDHEDCSRVINGSWNSHIEEEEIWKRILKKTTYCRRALSSWSKKTFRKADKEVEKQKAQLTELLNSPLIQTVKTGC
ncbi:Endonuclease/exonuclease/phosphatase superfamily [Sesbania bispinosa]|nr:Endonuclease/exonuclease/phosphatase superfamily [Sesbania bispinosa]